jgi:hypothetical protein
VKQHPPRIRRQSPGFLSPDQLLDLAPGEPEEPVGPEGVILSRDVTAGRLEASPGDPALDEEIHGERARFQPIPDAKKVADLLMREAAQLRRIMIDVTKPLLRSDASLEDQVDLAAEAPGFLEKLSSELYREPVEGVIVESRGIEVLSGAGKAPTDRIGGLRLVQEVTSMVATRRASRR